MKFEFSAGGVVFKKEKDRYLILVCKHSSLKHWGFPKGHIEEGIPLRQGFAGQAREKKEAAALREVKEETGVVGKIIRPLTPITYWYQWEGEKRKKTVYYFIMEYVSGDITKHDFEMEQVEWLPVEEVADRLTYPGDKKVWEEAKKLIA